MKEFNIFLPSAAICFIFIIALIVFFKGQNKRLTRIFLGFILCAIFWIIASTVADASLDPETALLWSRLAIIGPLLGSPLFFYFCYLFPDGRGRFSFSKLLILFTPSVIALAFVPTAYNVISVQVETWGTAFIPGPLYYILDIFLLFHFGGGIYSLWKKYKVSETERQRLQIRYCILGIASLVAIGLVTNSLLPSFFNYTKATIFGPSLAAALFILATGYAISRYRLLEIRIFLQRAVISFIGSVFAIIFISLFVGKIISNFTEILQTRVIIFSGILISMMLLTPFLKKWIEKDVKIFFPQETMEISKLFERTKYTINTTSLEEFVDKLKTAIFQQYGLNVEILFQDHEGEEFYRLRHGKTRRIWYAQKLLRILGNNNYYFLEEIPENDKNFRLAQKFLKQKMIAIFSLKRDEKFLGIMTLNLINTAKAENIHSLREAFTNIARKSARIIDDLRNLEEAKIGLRITAEKIYNQ